MEFPCCACCEPGGVGYQDHIDQGGTVERDKHETFCDTHQNADGTPKQKSVRLEDLAFSISTEDLTDLLAEHYLTTGIMASPTHWAYRGDWKPEGAAERHEGETPGKWFAGCGTGYPDQKGCGWDSEPTTYETKEEARRAALTHLAEKIKEAL